MGVHNDFLRIQKALTIKEKVDKLDFTKTKIKLASIERNHYGNEKATPRLGEKSVIIYLKKGSRISRIYKNSYKQKATMI